MGEGGWWGHCVPAGDMNNGKKNCGDNSDEGTSDAATCQWPFIKKADGTCKECEDSDVSTKCAPGQAISSDTQQSCICQKCIDGWIGSEWHPKRSTCRRRMCRQSKRQVLL